MEKGAATVRETSDEGKPRLTMASDRSFWLFFIIALVFIIIGFVYIMSGDRDYISWMTIPWFFTIVCLTVIFYCLYDQTTVCHTPCSLKDRGKKERRKTLICIVFGLSLFSSVLWTYELLHKNVMVCLYLNILLIFVGLLLLYVCWSVIGYEEKKDRTIRKYRDSVPFMVSIIYTCLWIVMLLIVIL